MNPRHERLNQELERMRDSIHNAWQPEQSSTDDPEVQALAALARSLRTAPPLQADSAFADRLERRIRAYSAALQRKHSADQGRRSILPSSLRGHPILTTALSLCLLVIFLGTGVLVAAAQVTNPSNPLYAIKHWEQQVQISLVGSPVDQAELDLHTARDQLNVLPGLIAQAGKYRHALADFDQQLGKVAQEIDALPAGADHTRLAGELAALHAEARSILRALLLRLAVPERQATTDELGRLGETVPHLRQVELTLPAHPNGLASIRISGENMQAGAQLLVNERLVPASSTFQQGSYVFTMRWTGKQHPHSIGIMNPDGMVAQTTMITVYTASDDAGNGNGSGNRNGKDSGNGEGNGNEGGGTPEKSPTPQP